MFAALVALCLTAVIAASPESETCLVCTAAALELIKRVPIVRRAGASDSDKAVAVSEATDNFCDNFGGGPYFADISAAQKTCTAFLKKSRASIEHVVQGGGDATAVCDSVCGGLDAAARTPHYTAPSRAKAKAPEKSVKGKGTVNDPKFKAALKKKAERDARRAKKASGGASEDEL